MTQRDESTLIRWKIDTFFEYLNLCIRLNEVPKKEIVSLIKGCSSSKILEETIDVFKSK
jgi:hypothetical protein